MPTILEVAGMMVAFATVSFVVTIARLCIRRPKNWGVDDALAVVTVLAIMSQATMMNLAMRRSPIIPKTPRASADVYYLNGSFFYIQDWAARLSILFTILRICPSPRMSTQIKCCAVLFAAGLAINIGLMIGTCHADESWARKSGLCPLNRSIPYVQMSTGIAADALLVYIPIRILRDLTSSPTLRRRLQIIFSITILLTVACIAQSVFVIKSPGLKVLIASSAEGFIAIMLCNSTIIVTAVIHLFKLSEEDSAPSGKTKKESSIVFNNKSTQSDSSGSDSSQIDTVNTFDVISTNDNSESTRGRSFMERWTTMDIDGALAKDLKAGREQHLESGETTPSTAVASTVKKQRSFLSDKDQARTI